MLWKIAVFLLALGAASSVEVTPARKCSTTPTKLFKSVVVSTENRVCTKFPCDFIKGKDVHANVTFVTPEEVDTIKLKAVVQVDSINVNYNVPNADKGCDMLTNTYCPIDKDTEADISVTMNVDKSFPELTFDLEFSLVDQSNTVISCFGLTGRVKRQ